MNFEENYLPNQSRYNIMYCPFIGVEVNGTWNCKWCVQFCAFFLLSNTFDEH